jgi:chromosomal replication initiation ATPase DnaA
MGVRVERKHTETALGFRKRKRTVPLETIVEVAGRELGVSRERMLGYKGPKKDRDARLIAMRIARDYGYTWEGIAKAVNRRHTAVRYGAMRAYDLEGFGFDPEFVAKIRRVRAALRGIEPSQSSESD